MDYYDLGAHSRPITTTSADAQTWFDRGLIWTYGFNHEEAIICFQKAIEADPNCAMAHWGIAYTIGPNYNKPWEAFDDEEKPDALSLASESIAAATRQLDNVTPEERALIEAIPARYPDSADIEDFAPWNDAFADAMRNVYKQFPDDLDLVCLYVEALMNRTPWQLWDLPTGNPAEGADTVEAMEVLDGKFSDVAAAWDHPGLLHLYCHLMEMSPMPERALRHGDRLADMVPDSGHLLHMATHIDVLCGDYMNVVSRNHAAIIADRKYLEHRGPNNFYALYRCHNYHFKIYGALFLGQPTPAFEAADELAATIPLETVQLMADWIEPFVPMKQHVYIRFGMWQDIVDQELPEDQELYSFTTTVMRYARTVALSNLGRLDEAEAEKELFYEARKTVPDTRYLFNNVALDILEVAEHMMLGELEYHKGNFDEAFKHLEKSIHLDDNLTYDEPWGWMQPTRHAYGALLLEQNRYEDAEAVYRADLGLDKTLSRPCQHPNNVWSLHGLHECLTHRGETTESALIKLQLDKALARAEVTIKASCYCRKKAAA